MTPSRAVDAFTRRHRYHPFEALPWAAAVASYFVFPDYLALGAQILATILFALSADLVLGYAGIVTLGHAAFFGTGAYTAGILAAHGWGEPITGLFAGGVAAAFLGFLSGLVVLRTTGLALLMQTLVVATLVAEAANKASFVTGGDDGLQGMEVWPIFGWFRFDLFGRTSYAYCLIVLFLCWLAARQMVHSPFGRSLTGIRENVRRMHAIGAPVGRRRLVIYTISAALAGVSGGLIAQTLVCGYAHLPNGSKWEQVMEGSQLVWGMTTVLLGVFAGLAAYWSVMNFPDVSSMLLAMLGGAALSAAMITSHLVRWPL